MVAYSPAYTGGKARPCSRQLVDKCSEKLRSTSCVVSVVVLLLHPPNALPHSHNKHFPPQTPSTNTFTNASSTTKQLNMSDLGSSPMFFSCFIGSIGLLASVLHSLVRPAAVFGRTTSSPNRGPDGLQSMQSTAKTFRKIQLFDSYIPMGFLSTRRRLQS